MKEHGAHWGRRAGRLKGEMSRRGDVRLYYIRDCWKRSCQSRGAVSPGVFVSCAS